MIGRFAILFEECAKALRDQKRGTLTEVSKSEARVPDGARASDVAREGGQSALSSSDVNFSGELRRLASTLDRVDHMGEVCRFIEKLVSGPSRAGVLLLCGGTQHAIPELALRLASLEHDLLPAPRRLASGKTVRPAGNGLRPFMVGDRLEDDLEDWIVSHVADLDDTALEKALHSASKEGDLWILTFRITGSRKAVPIVEEHLEKFGGAIDRALQIHAQSWGHAKFLIVYCVECEASQADVLTDRLRGYRLQPAKLMKDWPTVTGQDVDEWFDLLERRSSSSPVLKKIDLPAARCAVSDAVFASNPAKSATMYDANKAVLDCLSKHSRTGAPFAVPQQ